MVALVSSYLFGSEPVHLNSIYWRDDDVTQQYWTLPYVPGKRFGDKPVYALTSRDTFSAGEDLAYNLQARKRAILVGETTGGGAHAGTMVRLHPHIEAFIPSGRAIHPVTHTNWQSHGVTPDIAVSQEEALRVAYRMALESLLEAIDDAASGPYRRLLEEAQTALTTLATVGP